MAVVWQLSVVNFKNTSLLRAVVLKQKTPSTIGKKKAWTNFFDLSRSYFHKPCSDCQFIIKINNSEQYPVKTDKSGSLQLTLDYSGVNSVRVLTTDLKDEIPILQDYPLIFKYDKSPVNIISDIDDTLLISHTLNHRKRIGTTLFTPANRRKEIDFVGDILRKINDENGQIFYISKSESNLFGMLTSFIRLNDLPQGDLSLTSYLRFFQLLNPKKGIDYKYNMISRILQNSPEKKFILLGDDTQNDIQVYRDIINKFPEHILAVYIRKTRRFWKDKKNEDFKQLSDLGVKATYFQDDDDFESLKANFYNTLKTYTQ